MNFWWFFFAICVVFSFVLAVALVAIKDEQERANRIQQKYEEELTHLYESYKIQLEINNELIMRVARLEKDPMAALHRLPHHQIRKSGISWN